MKVSFLLSLCNNEMDWEKYGREEIAVNRSSLLDPVGERETETNFTSPKSISKSVSYPDE